MPEKTAEFFIRFLSEPASWERLGLKSSTAHRRRSWIREERRAKGYDVFEIAGSDLDDRDAMARHFYRLTCVLTGQDHAREIRDQPTWFGG